MSGDGLVMPKDAAGLQQYWEEFGGGRFGMPRADFVAVCRTLIRNGQLVAPEQEKLVAAGWIELRD